MEVLRQICTAHSFVCTKQDEFSIFFLNGVFNMTFKINVNRDVKHQLPGDRNALALSSRNLF